MLESTGLELGSDGTTRHAKLTDSNLDADGNPQNDHLH